MKHIIISLVTALLFVMNNMCQYNIVYADDLNIDAGDVEYIYYERSGGNGYPKVIDENYRKNHFSQKTYSRYDIEYIMHYLNSFDLADDGKTAGGSDIVTTSISIKTKENVFDMSFKMGRFIDCNNKQYGVDKIEYDRFMEFLYALHTGQIVLDDSSVLGASDWAEEYIQKAIGCNLIPAWNQIGYRCDITRSEVCQLIHNLLTIRNCGAEMINTDVFSDTTDPSVIYLYACDIVDGKDIEKFYPYDDLTREEFAKILSKAYHFIYKDADTVSPETEYADNGNISDWAKPYVSEMTALGVLQGDDNGCFDPQGELTKEQVIASLLRLCGADSSAASENK